MANLWRVTILSMARYHTLSYAVRSYGLSILFSFAIAVMLSSVLDGSGFKENLIISLSIGLSISTAFMFLGQLASQVLPPIVASVIVMLVGASIGVTLGSFFISGSLWTVFANNQTSWILGLFFGSIGLAIFSGREQLNATRLQLSEAKATQAAQEHQLVESQLRLLQAQIEPHFLFNTLSNVTSMIRTNPQGAEQTLNNLSSLLRHNLRRTREPTTTLGEELDILRAYLEIQKIRMGARLEYKLEVDAAIRSQPLPPMLIQPLVENAIAHGIEPQETGGEVVVSATVTGGALLIRVSDTGGGMQTMSSGSGTGLRNIRERLQVLFDGEASLRLTERKPHGIEAAMDIPVTSK